MNWRDEAACKGMDTNLFFYDEDTSIEDQLLVDSTCASCPVESQCLDWAILNKVEGGVFGRRFFAQQGKKKVKKRENVKV